jgi:hypothetical protein
MCREKEGKINVSAPGEVNSRCGVLDHENARRYSFSYHRIRQGLPIAERGGAKLAFFYHFV